MIRQSIAALGVVVATAPGAFAGADAPAVGDLRKVGRTHLQTSCHAAVRDDFASGVALLHSFFYEEARRVFTDVAGRDAGCAIAHWGIAMTWWHPIWSPPTAEERAAGRAAIDKARSIGGRLPLERGLIDALAAYYADPVRSSTAGPIGQSCHGATGGGDHAARAAAYEKAMAAVHAAHRDDIEAGTLYALALLASAPPGDRTLGNQTRATEILEPLRRRQPDHPGVLHYLIHGYDYPAVAEKGLAAAKAYAAISPWVPHVLHMPSHIFTRLGMWDEVIHSNLASSEASRQYEARMHPGATGFEELHAHDYLVYGYLQTAQDARALEIVQRMKAVTKTHPESDFVIAYAAGAVPARYALERRQWAEAAALVEPSVSLVKDYPFGSGHVAFARALGAARSGRLDEARKALARLEELTAAMTDPRQKYFALQAGMQAKVVQGWLAHEEGRPHDAERLLREAADADDALGKHPVSPASLVPAREVLADYLSARGRFGPARAEYEACLKLNPRRLNSLHGAGVAAEKAGDRAGALEHFRALAALAAQDADRAEVVSVRQFLAANDGRASR
jgi:tetratricopeptide (TPR) repeat protein